MTKFLISTLIILLVSCGTQLPKSAADTYLTAKTNGQKYYQCEFMLFHDSTNRKKLTQNEDSNLKAEYVLSVQLWMTSNTEVNELEKLHPEFSNTETALDYHKYVTDTISITQIFKLYPALLNDKYGKLWDK